MTSWIFEMANNHQGSVEHAKKIVKEFAQIAHDLNIQAGIKLQFRQLDTFIHKDFQESDLKYVKRFNSTRLSKDQFREIVDAIRAEELDVIATPFDNESLQWIFDLDVDIIKIASCSIDDWPLLREVAQLDRRVIISTAGASFDVLRKVHDLFLRNGRDFAFMHCVGEYPTLVHHANMNRVDMLRDMFPGIEIGLSTHELPLGMSVVPLALAKGCTIIEKHVGVGTADAPLNAYSNSPKDMRMVIEEAKLYEKALTGVPKNEAEALNNLKRGIYLKRDLPKGHIVEESDLYFAMPCQEGQANVSKIDQIVGHPISFDAKVDSPVASDACIPLSKIRKLNEIKDWLLRTAALSEINIHENDQVEISCHYGLENFNETGALIVSKVNREYCKKLIFMRPDQKHPSHHHVEKEEAFELLTGDCELVLNGKSISMELGRPYVIARGTKHSFSSRSGCIIEEISTTHVKGDSVYEDPEIVKKKVDDRKIYIKVY